MGSTLRVPVSTVPAVGRHPSRAVAISIASASAQSPIASVASRSARAPKKPIAGSTVTPASRARASKSEKSEVVEGCSAAMSR